MTTTDRTLRERLVAGAEDALGQVYDTHSGMVYGLALRITRDPCAAEDIVQEVFVGLWERPGAYDPDRGSLAPWLGTITRRRAIDRLRRDAVRHRSLVAVAAENSQVEQPDIAEGAVAADVARLVRTAVRELPEPHRLAVTLVYYDGLTYRQVAETLGIPEGTAKSRLRAALRGIATRLTELSITSARDANYS
ncbi:MAG: RNA polymerase sigma factor [Pseudonocardiales bacterium]